MALIIDNETPMDKKALKNKLKAIDFIFEDDEVTPVSTEPLAAPGPPLKEIAQAKGLPEVSDDGTIRPKLYCSVSFDKEIEDPNTKAKRPTQPDDYRPSKGDMTKINALTNVDLTPDKVYTFTLRSADTNIDRGYEFFVPKALKQMASMSVDKPFLVDHRWSTGNTIGKIYDASVKDNSLIQKVYMLDIPQNAYAVANIMGGIYNKVSVGFAMNPEDYVCNSCGSSMYSMNCKHQPGQTDEKGQVVTVKLAGVSDYYEISLVAVPMQPAAGIRRDQLPFMPFGAEQEEKSLGAHTKDLENNDVDRITNENLIIEDSSVSDKEKSIPETTVEEKTEAPVTEETVITETEEKGKKKSKNQKAFKKVNKAIKALKKQIKKVSKALKTQSEVLKSVLTAEAAQAELLQKATNTSTEEIVKQLMSTQIVAEKEATKEVTLKESLAGGLKSLLYADKENQ